MLRYYRLRYQQEFLIRDTTGPTLRQFTGLGERQAQSMNKIEFHTNMALSAVNIAKVEHGLTDEQAKRIPFSMADAKTRFHNELLLNRFISILPQTANIHLKGAQVRQLYSFGCVAA